MNCKPRRFVAIGVTFAASACILIATPPTQAAPAKPELEVRAESVLLKYFETVVYTKTEIIAPVTASLDKTGDITANISESTASLTVPFYDLVSGLRALDPDAERDLERNYGTVLVGAKDFGYEPNGPQGLGPVRSHRCYIGVSAVDAKPDIESDFRNASKVSVSGRTVWTWPMPSDEGPKKRPDQWFAAQLADSYIVISNDRQSFEETASALRATVPPGPEPIRAMGWTSLKAHNYWAYQSFLTERKQGMTPEFVALTFYADIEQGKGWIQLLSKNRSGKIAPNLFPDTGGQIQFEPQGAGTWGAIIPLPKKLNNDTLMALMSLLGFGESL